MDNIKDVQARDFSKFLDTEVKTNPFGDNKSGERAYRRAERVVAAIFLLTNHIRSEEPLRNELRSLSTSLLKNILSLRDEMRATTSRNVHELEATIRGMISLVRMLVFSGFVSPQNADAVSGALDELGNAVWLSQRSNLSESINISREMLLDVREYSKGHSKDIKDNSIVKDIPAIKDMEGTIEKTPVSSIQPSLTVRGAGIMDVLRGGGELTIRDIAAHFPEYAEKTIQRELVLLINRGFVRRIGLKRWSRYTVSS